RITVLKQGNIRNAVTCHHCESAPCLRSCPNGALTKNQQSIQLDERKCIGCKSCMLACPFGVMQMVESACGPHDTVTMHAHKCDLCHQRDAGPACVEQCP
ncbi:4Fe-4S dicluster domain-containing protein, partial [Atlantibacter subterraneus]